ncbi:GyrI-like domain-containing protein [Anaerocolumna sp. AGMB13025]|uniref:AraC family transcriptional regulator n=1 Tax=Anaerocolumna sp. AGMB13025 TaxID=3039116 RepID=UPI00241DF889|nr:GyrI-like domain-containing protein [Anaerocolumna sp. AGMB13025]WFR56836.1 GyrI-like domain-containing protein [Anaerocolumna sp. AGMB13025]
MSDKCKNEYISRICKVQDYIEKNYFHNVSVEKLADVAGFSRYHFNRIFKSILNESVSQYVNRIRIEHSLFLLAYRTDISLTDIALELGYTDSAIFSRAFKNNYGISPYAYRKKYSTKCKENIFISEYNEPVKKKKWVQKSYLNLGEIRIESRDEVPAVYVRHVGNYKSLEKKYTKLMHRLCREAAKQHLMDHDNVEILAMYHDNPEFSLEDQFRTSLCVSLPKGTNPLVNDKLGVMKIEGGLYAIGHFRIQQEQFQDAWDFMYQQWLFTSDYVPRDVCPFEVYLNNPMEEANHHIEVDIYMPIEPI